MLCNRDFPFEEEQTVKMCQRLDNKELCNEYLAVQGCYEVLDNLDDATDYVDTFVIHFLDFIGGYLEQEICSRFCGLNSDLAVPRYPLV